MTKYNIVLVAKTMIVLAVCSVMPAQAVSVDPSKDELIPTRVESEVVANSTGSQTHIIRPRTPLTLRDTTIVLEPPTAERLAAIQPARKYGPLQIGISQEVPGARSPAETRNLLIWNDTSQGGKIAALKIVSPNALGLRMGILINKLPENARLRFYASGSDTATEVSAQVILGIVASNRDAGDLSDEGKTYWSPAIEGNEAIVEIELSPGQNPPDVDIALPRVSHLFAPVHSTVKSIGSADTCNLDATCYASWDDQSKAVAKMSFVKSGASYTCSGTLINDKDTSTAIPYFLSANHCISSQTVASTLISYWLYRASSCHSGALSGGSQSLSGGATLLDANAGTDTSFMQLNSTPPAGVLFAGWDSNIPSLSTAITGIHHPSGDLQKISFGTLTAYESCPAGSGSTYSCNTTSANSADHYSVVWNSGITEGGSSGSGLFISNTHYLIGTLHGGESFCATPSAPDDYGSFSRAFNAALYQWLNKTELTVSRAGTGSGNVYSGPAGISCGGDCSESYYNATSVTLSASPASGSNFAGWSGDCSGTGLCTLTMSSSHAVTANFNLNPVTIPGAPTIVWITRGPGSTTISFTAPSNNGGSPITGYVASCSAAGKTTRTVSGSGSPLTVTGLTGGVLYSCSVTASNSIGTGAPSAASSVTPTPKGITPILMLLLD